MSLFRKLTKRKARRLSPDPSQIVNIVLMGAARTGKTSILTRLLLDEFYPAYLPTIEPGEYKLGDCVYRLETKIGKKHISIDFFDTPGFYQSPPMKQFLISEADVFILIYAIDEYRSFQEIFVILNEIRAQRPRARVLLIGNKADLNAYRAVSYASVEEFGSLHGISVFETSAKFDGNIQTPLHKFLQSEPSLHISDHVTSLKSPFRGFFSR